MGLSFPVQLCKVCSVLVAITAVLISAGCESTRGLSGVPDGESTQVGLSEIWTVEKKHQVWVELLTSVFSNETHQLPTFAVTVANRGTEPVILTRGNLRVFSGDQRVRIYTADQLTTRIDSEAKEKADAYTGRQAEVFLQSDATRVDPSAALANLEAAKRANLAGKNRTGREEQLRALANLLDHVKIAPNASGGGVARLHEPDIQSGKPLKFMVAIDNEIYAFTFDVKGG